MPTRSFGKNSLRLVKEDFLELERIIRSNMQTDQLEVSIKVHDKDKGIDKKSIEEISEEISNNKIAEQLYSIQMKFSEYSFTATREIKLECNNSVCMVTIEADENSWKMKINPDNWVHDASEAIDTFLDKRNSKFYFVFTKIPYTFWLFIVGIIITLLPLSFPNNKIAVCIITAVSFSVGTILANKTKWFLEKFPPIKFSLSSKN